MLSLSSSHGLFFVNDEDSTVMVRSKCSPRGAGAAAAAAEVAAVALSSRLVGNDTSDMLVGWVCMFAIHVTTYS